MSVERRARRRGVGSAWMSIAMVGSRPRAATNIAALVTALRRQGFELAPRVVPTYAALYAEMCSGRCELAWAPPLVAHDLWRCGAATPLVRPVRSGQTSYYAMLLARRDDHASLQDYEGARVGWVAPESAAGHVVPKLGLRSLGIDADRFFAQRRFLGTHGAAIAAALSRDVDVVATYAALDPASGTFLKPQGADALRSLTAFGPIPSDVIVVRPIVSPVTQRHLREAFEAVTASELPASADAMSFERFEPARPGHLKPLEDLDLRSAEASLRVFAPSRSEPPPLGREATVS